MFPSIGMALSFSLHLRTEFFGDFSQKYEKTDIVDLTMDQ